MLPVTNNLSVFHLPYVDAFQDDQLNDLARQRRETEWPVVLWVSFFFLFKNLFYVFTFPVSRSFTGLPQLFKDYVYWLSNFIHCFPQDPQMHFIGPRGLVHIQVP